MAYKIDRARDYRRFRLELVVILLVVLVVIVGVVYLLIDLSKPQAVVDNSQNKAVLGFSEDDGERFIGFPQELFTIYLPEDWLEISKPEIIASSYRYYPFRFQGTAEKHVGKIIDVYVGRIPAQLPVNKIMLVEISANGGIEYLKVSPQCSSFTKYPNQYAGQAYPSSWEGIDFFCDTHGYRNKVAAVVGKFGEGVMLTNNEKKHRFLITYQDHGSEIGNLNLFIQVLNRFRMN